MHSNIHGSSGIPIHDLSVGALDCAATVIGIPLLHHCLLNPDLATDVSSDWTIPAVSDPSATFASAANTVRRDIEEFKTQTISLNYALYLLKYLIKINIYIQAYMFFSLRVMIGVIMLIELCQVLSFISVCVFVFIFARGCYNWPSVYWLVMQRNKEFNCI
jgi:hypothetical protein